MARHSRTAAKTAGNGVGRVWRALIVLAASASGGAVAQSAAPGYAELTGSRFVAAPADPLQAPSVTELTLPQIADGNAIWGATGRDARGHVWVGVSAKSPGMSAHLFEYDPKAGSWRDHGGVVDQLKAAGLHRHGEGQVKIHSRIVPGADGWLYFASMDEEGEQADGSALPIWGGHLWRIHPVRGTWEHLLTTPEGLVAVSGVGRYVYALGYWGHVLYQYDTASKAIGRVAVGSVGGHTSRNVLSDARGHAFVPRVSTAAKGRTPDVSLVEYDTALREIGQTPLDFYLDKTRPVPMNHGIVGLAYRPSGELLFTTHPGHLYAIEARGDGPAQVRSLGWMGSNRNTYTPSLFVLGGDHQVAGVGYRRRPLGFDWLVRDLAGGQAGAFPIDIGSLENVLLYGSITRDDAGRMYVGGWTAAGERGRARRPLLLQITPPQ